MATQSWQQQIRRTLNGLPRPGASHKIAILGVGNELFADDAIGLEVARYLLSTDFAHRKDRIVLVGGPAPESYCGVLRRFMPELVILIDAASMGQAEGSIRWLALEALEGCFLSSRAVPLRVMAAYLTADLGCVVGLLAIQPGKVMIGPMSPSLQPKVIEIGEQLREVLHLNGDSPAIDVGRAPALHRKRI